MALISEAYREQNRRLHAGNVLYGKNGGRNALEVLRLAGKYEAQTVLDYGCGKCGLAAALGESGLVVSNYDPAIDELSADPAPADIVVCADVLEHVEPECIGDVLDHIGSKILKVGLLLVACRPATKFLPDGRNAHLIVENPLWWLKVVGDRLDIFNSKNRPHQGEVVFYVGKK